MKVIPLRPEPTWITNIKTLMRLRGGMTQAELGTRVLVLEERDFRRNYSTEPREGKKTSERESRLGGVRRDISEMLTGKMNRWAGDIYLGFILRIAEALQAPIEILFSREYEEEEIDELIRNYEWVKQRPPRDRRLIVQFGILTFKMYHEAMYEDILEIPPIRLGK